MVVATAGMVQAECPDFLFRTEVSHYNIYWKHEWQKSLVGAVGSINFLATACSGNCSLLNTSYEENWIHVFCRGCFFGAFKKNGCFKNYTTKTVAHGLCSDAHIFNAFFMVKLVAPDIMSRCAWQMQRHPNFTSRIC